MARAAPRFTCQSCGATHKKWAGRCDACGEWNTIEEEAAAVTGPGAAAKTGGRVIELGGLDAADAPLTRRESGIAELNRVLGGGLVPASAILVGGDPGIGKSTLLLQAAADFAAQGASVAYITGEEAAAQVRLRADRLGLRDSPLALGAETNLRDILATLDKTRPDLAIIDSIQTLFSEALEKSRDFLDAGSNVVVTCEATLEADQLKLLGRSVAPIDVVAAQAGRTDIRLFLDDISAAAAVKSLLDRAEADGASKSRGSVALCLMAADLPGEVHLELQGDFPVNPQIKSALKSLGGVVTVEDI